jgi:hypothetical protein
MLNYCDLIFLPRARRLPWPSFAVRLSGGERRRAVDFNPFSAGGSWPAFPVRLTGYGWHALQNMRFSNVYQ